MAGYADVLFEKAREAGAESLTLFDPAVADLLDAQDPLAEFRAEYLFPKGKDGKDAIYLCGNSLGLQPRDMKRQVVAQLDKWGAEGVEGHFAGQTPWLDIDDIVVPSMARLVGAEVSEVVVMNSLTCNLHLMMAAFYQPSATRFKIVIERKAFPSDYHAVVSQIQLAGYDPDLALVEIAPREGETSLREEDIEITLEQHCAALVLFSGVQYYTGQLFDMQRITKAAHAQGAMVGFDLAHAVGNVPLSLHEWGPDFACWCTYKYMNCGPGSLGGCFVHARHGGGEGGEGEGGEGEGRTGTQRFNRPKPPRMAGWWGHRRQDRFRMEPDFIPCLGANGFRLSNPPVLLVACIRASLDLFDRAGMDKLRSKSLLLTGYLESLLRSELSNDVSIFTPADPQQRGCQLSLSFSACTVAEGAGVEEGVKVSTHIDIDTILEALQSEGVICDARKPNVIRIAPTPMYNSFRDVFEFVRILKAVLAGL